MLILLFGTICLLVFIAALMGGDFVSSSYKTTIHGRYRVAKWLRGHVAIILRGTASSGGVFCSKSVSFSIVTYSITRFTAKSSQS